MNLTVIYDTKGKKRLLQESLAWIVYGQIKESFSI